jgi:integrase/recombinase XerD
MACTAGAGIMSTLRQAAEDYLALRRSMGFTLTVPGRQVQQFADHLDTLDATHVTIDLAVAWATRPAGTAPYYQWLRLSAVRGLLATCTASTPRIRFRPRICCRANSTGPPLICCRQRTSPR